MRDMPRHTIDCLSLLLSLTILGVSGGEIFAQRGRALFKKPQLSTLPARPLSRPGNLQNALPGPSLKAAPTSPRSGNTADPHRTTGTYDSLIPRAGMHYQIQQEQEKRRKAAAAVPASPPVQANAFVRVMIGILFLLALAGCAVWIVASHYRACLAVLRTWFNR